jgi:hypothetical protein
MPRRKVLALRLALVVGVVVFLMVAFVGVAYGGGRSGTEEVVVQPGQSLWTIAQQRYPDDDTRSRVGDIIRLNHLGEQPIYAGEKLQVPAN